MIDPTDPPDVRVVKQQKIIDALVRRAERSVSIDNSAYALFNSAISLQRQVWAKDKDLEHALHTLGRASDELQSAQSEREEIQNALADAVDAMESGFAIFSGGQLTICNALFRNLLPDVSRAVRKGMHLDSYFEKLCSSRFVDGSLLQEYPFAEEATTVDETSFVLPVKGDRWFQITQRSGEKNTVVLQTEVTAIIRRDRAERDRLRDDQTNVIQSAFDHMNYGVCTFTDKGRVIRANARFRNFLSLPMRMCAEDTDLHELLYFLESNQSLHKVDYDSWADEILGPLEAEWDLRHRNGRVLAMNMRRMPNGARLLIVRDVTNETQTMETLERRVEEAVRSKTHFLAAASHDLLQPINAAKLYLSMLTEGTAGTDLAQTAERLEKAFGSMEWQLQSLLELARLDSTGVDFNVTSCALQPLFDAILTDTLALAQNRGVSLNCVETSLWTKSDPRYLLRSIQNLVVNAIQYTPAGGRVLLGCRVVGDQIAIEVHDTGEGISEPDQARIFEAFTRLDRSRDGTGMGLGLSIVEHACRHLGHAISLASTPGKGSVFCIMVPLTERRKVVPDSLLKTPHESEEGLDLIVLVVENDADVLKAMSQRMETWGCSVLAATSTAEAVQMVNELGMAPDVMLVDYQLDGEDTGLRTIDRLRTATASHIPAIMITAHREEFLNDRAKQDDFTILSKPVQLSRLRPLINWKVSDLDKSVG